MLKPQRAILPFNKGIDRGGNDPLVTADLLVAQNCIHELNGAISKRYGRSLLSGTNPGDNLGEHKGRPVIYGDTVKKLNGATLPGGTFDTIEDRCGLIDIDSEPYVATGDDLGDYGTTIATICRPEMYQLGEVLFATYFYNGDQVAKSFNVRSKKQIDSAATDISTYTYQNSRLVCLDAEDYVYHIYVNDSRQVVINCYAAAGTITGATAINLASGSSWVTADEHVPIDACQIDTDKIAIVYKQQGSDNLVVGWVQLSGTSLSAEGVTTTAVTSLGYVCCCKFATGEVFVGVYGETATRSIQGIVYDDSDPPAVVVTAATLTTFATDEIGQMCAVLADTNEAWIYWTRVNVWAFADIDDDRHDALLERQKFTNSGGTGTAGTKVILGGDCAIWSKPMLATTGDMHLGVIAAYTGGLGGGYQTHDEQRKYLVVRDNGGVSGDYLPLPLGIWFDGLADHLDITEQALGWSRVHNAHVCTPQAIGSDVFSIPGLERGQSVWGSSLGSKSILHQVSVDLSADQVRTDVSGPNEMVVPSSCPVAFDGGRVFEAGFLLAPPSPELELNGSASNLTAGLYTYALLYELTDINGNVWRSPLSVVSTVTVSASLEDVRVYARTLKWSNAHYLGNLKIVLYRSETPGSTVLRRKKVWNNDPQVRLANGDTYYTDSGEAVGAEITDNEQEYTRYGRIRDNDTPPPSRVGAIWKSRAFLVHRQFEDRLIRYSKEFVEGEGYSWPNGHYFTVPPDGGDIKALAPMDDKLLILKRRQVLFTHGNGKDGQGAGENFADPVLVADGVGCLDQRSVVTAPVGTFFLSDDGINLVDRQMSLKPVGRRVREITDGCSITRAVLMTRDNHVLFFTDDGTEDVLVYNYLYDRWTVWRNWAADDAVVVDGELYTKPAGTTQVSYLDRATRYDTGGTWVPMRVRIAPVSLSGLFSSKRLWETWLLGYFSGQIVTIRVAYEGDPVWTDTLTFDALDIESTTQEHLQSDNYSANSFYTAAQFGDRVGLLRWRGSRTRIEHTIQIEIEDSG